MTPVDLLPECERFERFAERVWHDFQKLAGCDDCYVDKIGLRAILGSLLYAVVCLLRRAGFLLKTTSTIPGAAIFGALRFVFLVYPVRDLGVPVAATTKAMQCWMRDGSCFQTDTRRYHAICLPYLR